MSDQSTRAMRAETDQQVANQHELDLSEVSATTPFVQDATLSAAQGFPSLPADANKALVYVEGQAVRWRPDAVDPTAAIGMVLAVGSTTLFSWGQAALANVRFIEAAATAKINVIYYR